MAVFPIVPTFVRLHIRSDLSSRKHPCRFPHVMQQTMVQTTLIVMYSLTSTHLPHASVKLGHELHLESAIVLHVELRALPPGDVVYGERGRGMPIAGGLQTLLLPSRHKLQPIQHTCETLVAGTSSWPCWKVCRA